MARAPLSDPTVVLTCSRCGASGPANEVFYLTSAGAVTQSWCRECEQQRVREHEARRPVHGPPVPIGHRVMIKPRRRNTKVVVVDGIEVRPCSRCGEWKTLDRFSFQKDRQVYMSHCKDCRTQFERARREAGLRKTPDLEHKRELARVWRAANPERSRMGVRRRRARLRDAEGGYTVEEWLETLEVWDNRCAYCNRHAPGKLHADHIRPVSRGGADSIGNIAPACQRCNLSKGALTDREFMQGPRRPVRVA